MKKLLIIKLLFFISCYAYSQNQTIGRRNNKVEVMGRLAVDSVDFVSFATDTVLYRAADGTIKRTVIVSSAHSRIDSGRIVYDSALDFHSTIIYYHILGRAFTAPITAFTLAPATFDRTDVIFVDTLGNLGVLTGDISGLKPQVDPASQLEVASVDISAFATTPTGFSNIDVYKENVEFTLSGDATGLTGDYLTNPYAGLKSTYVSSFTNNMYLQYVGTTFNLNDLTYLKFWIRLNTAFAGGTFLSVKFQEGAAKRTNYESITNGTYGFNSALVGVYQQVIVPMSAFAYSISSADGIYFNLSGASAGSFQLDNIQLQGGGASPSGPVLSVDGKVGHVITNKMDTVYKTGTTTYYVRGSTVWSIPDALKDSITVQNKWFGIIPAGTMGNLKDSLYFKEDSLPASGGGGGISEVVAGYGLANVNDSTLRVDSAVIATRARLLNELALKQNLIPTGTTDQYFRGDLSLATFPTIPAQFNPIAGTNMTITGTYPNITFDASGGGGSQTLQQVLTAGATLTQLNTINNGGFLQISNNGKNQFDSISINPSTFVADSLWFDGTSITLGSGASSIDNRYATLVSNKLGALESNHGVGGARMYVEGIGATHLGVIPTYSATKYRAMVLEWGTNDMQLGVTDTATYAAAYLRYLDTAIARGWPVGKIIVLSPSWIDSTVQAAATTARQTMFNICTQTIAARRGTLYIDNYAIEVVKGKAVLLTDGIHPNNSGVSLAYVNPIINKLGDSVRVQGQQVQVNGLAEFQKLKFKLVDTASAKSVALGLDSAGNVVRYDHAGLIANGEILLQPQGASININGRALIGGVTSPTAVEKVQVAGMIKAQSGRFTLGSPTGLTGASTEIGFTSSQGFVNAYDRTAVAARVLVLNSLGGQVLVGNYTAGGSHTIGASGIQGGFGQFVGALSPSVGSGVEIANVSGMGYIGAYNRSGGAAINMSFMPLGGLTFFGALAASGSNTWQFTGTGHFSTSLNVGATATPTSALQTTAFATGYAAKTTTYTIAATDHTINCTSGTFTVTLPTAGSITGRQYVIVNSGTGTITIATTSSQTFVNINTAPTTLTLGAVGAAAITSYTVQSNGANWIVTAKVKDE